jgi:hypothetical protein
VLGAAAALLGTLITGATSRREDRNRWRRESYQHLVETLRQFLILNPDKDLANPLVWELQRALARVDIAASRSVRRALDGVAKLILAPGPVDVMAIQEPFEKLILAVRADLGVTE